MNNLLNTVIKPLKLILNTALHMKNWLTLI